MESSSKGSRLPSSFRDPDGFVFSSGVDLLRQINRSYQPSYEQLMKSGLYEKLVAEELLVAHEEVPLSNALTAEAALVIKPRLIPFISYPYEWSFSQLKDAALATLRVQSLALEHGMILKDASAYNVQFISGRPQLIDTLSFETYREGQAWDAYGQFCRHFLAPLALMQYTDIRLQQLLRAYIDGIPLDLATKLLPFRSLLNLSLLSHIHLHAMGQKHYADKQLKPGQKQLKRFSLMALLDSQQSAVQKLKWAPAGTEWGDYYRNTNYSSEAFASKAVLVSGFLQQLRPETVWDLGANDGTFSRLAAEAGAATIAFDIDPAAVEHNYRQVRQKGEERLLPLLVDLTNPSPAIGWAHRERLSLAERGPADVALALALIHHLCIGNNLPFEKAAEFLHTICRHLIIEFVPKHDSQVQRMLASRKDVFSSYTEETFEKAFGRYFTIREELPVQGSERKLYRMERKEQV